ncbi:MAG: protein-L-isoaspartate O-methyltransferase [Alphaproteobacteria bacterium]|nr:protein-L-isoaspartate O-methyltransferase [Alphaproteobacteria bacterium]
MMNDFAEARRHMVESQLRPREVTDKALLAAMLDVPRERFVPETRAGLAYSDMRHVLPGAGDRVLPAPEAFARLVQLGEITRSDVVLDVACGTGYSSAVLARIAGAVVALEEDSELAAMADAALTGLEVGNAVVLTGPLAAGVASEAPFDVIVIEGAVAIMPDALFDQLKEGGRLVTGMAHGRTVVASLFVKAGGIVAQHAMFNIGLPALSAFAAPSGFSF